MTWTKSLFCSSDRFNSFPYTALRGLSRSCIPVTLFLTIGGVHWLGNHFGDVRISTQTSPLHHSFYWKLALDLQIKETLSILPDRKQDTNSEYVLLCRSPTTFSYHTVGPYILRSHIFGEVAASVFAVGLRSSSIPLSVLYVCTLTMCVAQFSLADTLYAFLTDALPSTSWRKFCCCHLFSGGCLATDWNVLDGCFAIVVVPCMVMLHPFYRFRCFG